MIRSFWVGIVLILATLFFGMLVIVAALFRVRGRLYFRATQLWSRTVLWASGTRVIAHDLDAVDWDVPLVLVSNHVAQFDILAIASVLPSHFSFVGKKELDSIPFFGTAWKAAGHISIDRSDRQKAIASLQRAGERLKKERGTIIIFPEGTRSRDGVLLPFKKGAFTLAKNVGLPVVPAVVRGSEKVVEGWRVRPHPIHVYFGRPVEPDEVEGGPDALLLTVRERMTTMLDPHESGAGALPG